jgi:hypothetical protein
MYSIGISRTHARTRVILSQDRDIRTTSPRSSPRSDRLARRPERSFGKLGVLRGLGLFKVGRAHPEVPPRIGGRTTRAPVGPVSVQDRQQPYEGDEPDQNNQQQHKSDRPPWITTRSTRSPTFQAGLS